MLKKPSVLMLLVLLITSLSCSLPIQFENNDPSPTAPSPIQDATVPVNENPSPAPPVGVIPNDDPLLGSWTVFQVSTNFQSTISHDESQTWLGNLAFFNPDSIQINQNRCLLTTFERSPLPENYQENFPLDLSRYGLLEDQISLIRTNCTESPFGLFLQLDSYTLLINWQGSFMWLQQQTINAPKRPIVFSNTHYLQENITRNVNVQIPQITQTTAARQIFNDAAFNIFNDITVSFITETENWVPPADQNFPPSELEVTYEIHWNDGQRLSILGQIYTYYAGAAHPNMFYITLNYDLTTQQVLQLDDFFIAGSDYLNLLKNTCAAELISRDIGFFEDNLAAEPTYFKNITFTPAGLMVHFSPYDVASYAAGPQTVLIPYPVLEGTLKPEYFPPAIP
ncbi:MAG: hypothetical protein CL609_11580 [Anaerolineaceae bacterium]|nr:hypothetical protein [Anaerolineaceae bacterium]